MLWSGESFQIDLDRRHRGRGDLVGVGLEVAVASEVVGKAVLPLIRADWSVDSLLGPRLLGLNPCQSPGNLVNRGLGIVLNGLGGDGFVTNRLYLHRSWLDPFFSIGPCQKKK